MLETGFVACVFIYISFFLSVQFITLLLFSAVTAAIAVSTHLLRLHQLRLRLHLLRLHLLRLRLLLPRAAPAAAALPEVYAAERLSVKFQFSASLT